MNTGERGGSVVECRTPEREVRGSRPTVAVLCPWARHFTPRKYWLITQEAMAPSRHDWKIVDWDVKPQHNQPTPNEHFEYGYPHSNTPFNIYSWKAQLFAPNWSFVSNVKQLRQPITSDVTYDVGAPTVYRRIYWRKFLTLSNQTSGYIRKCIRIRFIRHPRVAVVYLPGVQLATGKKSRFLYIFESAGSQPAPVRIPVIALVV